MDSILTRTVVDAVPAIILSRGLAGGDVVNERHLAEHPGVSRTPVPEALPGAPDAIKSGDARGALQ